MGAKKHDKKQNILDAASALFLEGGTAALSVRAIAARAGVSTIGIYSHFDGKQGILDALYIEGFLRVDAAMSVLDSALTPREAIALAANNYLDIAASYPAHYSLVFGETDSSYTPSDEAKLAGVSAFAKLTALAGSILTENAQEADKQMCAIQVWSLMHGAVSLQRLDVSKIVDMSSWRERTLESVLILVDGMSA